MPVTTSKGPKTPRLQPPAVTNRRALQPTTQKHVSPSHGKMRQRGNRSGAAQVPVQRPDPHRCQLGTRKQPWSRHAFAATHACHPAEPTAPKAQLKGAPGAGMPNCPCLPGGSSQNASGNKWESAARYPVCIFALTVTDGCVSHIVAVGLGPGSLSRSESIAAHLQSQARPQRLAPQRTQREFRRSIAY